jgi:hypothetical protein
MSKARSDAVRGMSEEGLITAQQAAVEEVMAKHNRSLSELSHREQMASVVNLVSSAELEQQHREEEANKDFLAARATTLDQVLTVLLPDWAWSGLRCSRTDWENSYAQMHTRLVHRCDSKDRVDQETAPLFALASEVCKDASFGHPVEECMRTFALEADRMCRGREDMVVEARAIMTRLLRMCFGSVILENIDKYSHLFPEGF